MDLEDFQEVAVLADLKKKRKLKENEDKKNVSTISHAYLCCIIEKRKQEAGPSRVGRKKKKRGLEASTKLPNSKSI